MAVPYVIGVDLGGSVTRVLVVDTAGVRVGYGTAGGGNPVSRGLDATVSSLGEALATALDGVPADRVAYAVLGLAGGSTFGAAVDAGIEVVWRSAGLSCPRALRPDTEVAFAAGTPETDGFVLVAGTGAVAGLVRDTEIVLSVDGHGWLLGDRGSGFWIGREGVLAALASGEQYGPATPLRTAIARELGLDPDAVTSPEIARVVYQRPPVALAELAP
ncbi:MAG TPA: BadF/BadG/BcrA/BcrD ATPase family protein, partial [Micromonosporaceae bacterium]